MAETPDAPVPNEVLATALRLQEFCRGMGWQFCFIGGLAVQKWSEPRVTDDVDITLMTGFGKEQPFIDALLALDWIEPRNPHAREWALTRRVLLLQTKDGVGMDIAMGAFPFEQQAVSRAVEVEFLPGCSLRICTAEDLIIYKAFATRAKDWLDVEAVLKRQGAGNLDWRHIREQLTPLLALKEAPELLDQLEALREKIHRRQQGAT